MRVIRLASVACLASALAVGCSSSTPAANAGDAAPAAAAAVPAPATPSGPGVVSGKAPAAVNGFPSFVILEPQAGEPTPQAAPPVMDQVQQTFLPGVLLVRTGQPVEFRNSDEILHNVRVREDATREPAFNVAIPTGQKYDFTFQRDGFYDVGCDIHPTMTAQILASSSPYMTIAGNTGEFVIQNVPPGTYKAVVYAGADKVERTLTIAGATSNLDLSKP